MKSKKIQKKLHFSKTTISNLNREAMGNVQGGDVIQILSLPDCFVTQAREFCNTELRTCNTCIDTCGHYYCQYPWELTIEQHG